MSRLTDERLAELKAAVRQFGRLGGGACDQLIAEVERLRSENDAATKRAIMLDDRITDLEKERDEARAEAERYYRHGDAGIDGDERDKALEDLDRAEQATAELVAGLRKIADRIREQCSDEPQSKSWEFWFAAMQTISAMAATHLAKHAPAEGVQQWPKTDVTGNVIDNGPPAEGEGGRP